MQVGIKPGTTYTIKPLVFVRVGDGWYSEGGGTFIIWEDTELGWCWRDRFMRHPNHPYDSMCGSYERAVELCQAHWESDQGVGRFLESVEK